MQRDMEGVFLCEDVSEITFANGLFYLTDDFGEFRIKRAMRPSTFFRCVRGAMEVVKEFEAHEGTVSDLPGAHG